MNINFDELPSVPPDLRPKVLFIAQNLSEIEDTALKNNGWRVQDIRLMPSSTLHDKKEVCFAWLEGARQGSVFLTKFQLEAIELEMRACGLLSNKTALETPKSDLGQDDVDIILNAARSARAHRGTYGQNATKYTPEVSIPPGLAGVIIRNPDKVLVLDQVPKRKRTKKVASTVPK